jgi:adenylate cyclase
MARKIFETRYFGLIIGVLVAGVLVLLMFFTLIPERLELKTLTLHFRLKNVFQGETIQEGVVFQEQNPAISPDIVIVGIDTNSLNRFGRWPWPRWRHADLVNSLARIADQRNRERALFLDLFFIEPSDDAYSDAVLIDAIRSNERVFLETVLSNEFPPPAAADEYFTRHEVLFDSLGRIDNVQGDWWTMRTHFGIEPPLQPYGRVASGYGHANFDQDWDAVFRRQPLIAKVSRLVDEIRLDELSESYTVDTARYERLAWVDRDGVYHHIEHPLTPEILADLEREMSVRAPQAAVDTDNDGEADEYFYVVRKFRDQFLPSITLSLALDYFNKDFDDLEVVLGDHIRIPDVEVFNPETQSWGEYRVPVRLAEYDEEGNVTEEAVTRVVDEIVIPINEDGEMLINFMGIRSSAARDGYQTFPVRSFSAYASRVPAPDPFTWNRPTLALENKIVMVGPFSTGMAEDEKLTPYGLMFGVEMHANALNTIIMDRFLNYAPIWMDLGILVVATLLIAWLAAALKRVWGSFLIMLGIIIVYFFAVTIIFDTQAFILNFTSPAIAMIVTFVAVVVYRVITEERKSAYIKETFGKYVSPDIVDQLVNDPPELGGEDKEVTVLFSDIRGFTTLSESMTPQELVEHLNTYLTAMSDIVVEEFQGTLDKYVGDEIMCFWGAPRPQPDHAILACKCALRQMEKLAELNAGWPEVKQLDIGIGINTGQMTVANMGSPRRMDYTVIGDNVNLGARLEGTNKQYVVPNKATHFSKIIISESTYGQVRDQVVVRELDNIRVKGKNKPVVIYELIDIADGTDGAPGSTT